MATTALCLLLTALSLTSGKRPVPDEQRLYRRLMDSYEESVRPVLNASSKILVSFSLSLNQIIDLDERSQMLTTNVFIDQRWQDEQLSWDPSDYSGIKTLRIPARKVWLPDTFIFNNADDGFTGFVQGVFIMLDHNGTVMWPSPVKLKSSCKVDIRYFPFDDQKCVLRFGSWIYTSDWVDYQSSLADIDLNNYIDNSEWELMSLAFQVGKIQARLRDMRTYACCRETHTDLTYTLHIRRRALYYIFNIIVPCIMLSVLTLLTFWLPPTSGEKISLGLSVFLAFSMFMLLIAEEVPPSSESVPLIGVYLTTVMSMTSISVILAVIVINMHNRGGKGKRAPTWLKVLSLDWLSKMLRLKYDLQRMVLAIKLGVEEEEKYWCEKHSSRRASLILPSHPDVTSPGEGTSEESHHRVGHLPNGYLSPSTARAAPPPTPEPETEEVWVRREPAERPPQDITRVRSRSNLAVSSTNLYSSQINLKKLNIGRYAALCHKEQALVNRKEIIVEWQIIATVLDRLLFWIFLLLTVCTFIILIIVIPRTKRGLEVNPNHLPHYQVIVQPLSHLSYKMAT